ncbi:MAG TPA: GNAT family N-acetyltransferase [Nitrospirota bacterium]|nr:GNAT family N-acetyltransferase [Nitrospirota bacterium]
MADPRKTGVSGITGKMVSIRHATGSDLINVEEYLRDHHAGSDLGNAEVVVAAEERRIIGFGILKKENDAGCISLFEDSRRKGIGSSIIKHLAEHALLKRVYASRYASYFTHAGFSRVQKGPSPRATRSGDPCRGHLMERLSLAAYGK